MVNLKRALCTFKTIKFVKVTSVPLTLVHYGVMIFVLLYVATFQIFGVGMQTSGYNKNGAFIGTASVKLKGIANTTGYDGMPVTYDAYDLVHPPKERDASFVATRVLESVGQTKGTCANDDSAAMCANDDDCSRGMFVGTEVDNSAEAFQTGVCCPAGGGAGCATANRCQVTGWCPLEKKYDPPAINDVRLWTAFIRIDGTFPSLDPSRAFSTVGDDTKLTMYKNLFYIQDIVAAADLDDPCVLPSFTDPTDGPVCSDAAFRRSATKGTIILMNVDYGTTKVPCSLNSWNKENCEPTITFQRVDPTAPGVVSTGENFRRTREYYEGGVLTRDLIKLYGIRLLIKPQGVGAKFNFQTLILTIGSGLALLSIATLVSDYTLAYLPARLLCCADEKAALLKARVEKYDMVTVADEDLLLAEHASRTSLLGGSISGVNGESSGERASYAAMDGIERA